MLRLNKENFEGEELPHDTAQKTIFPFFSNVLKRWNFHKIALECDLSCNMREDDTSFSRKYELIL